MPPHSLLAVCTEFLCKHGAARWRFGFSGWSVRVLDTHLNILLQQLEGGLGLPSLTLWDRGSPASLIACSDRTTKTRLFRGIFGGEANLGLLSATHAITRSRIARLGACQRNRVMICVHSNSRVSMRGDRRNVLSKVFWL